ncbi:11862_t:CDS:1 [Gigaspora rosea]|nr:11862_t:CDS:1 [Gigaspora rosea]
MAPRQIIALYKQVNQEDSRSGLARIRIKQEYFNAGLTKEIEDNVTMQELYRA